MTDAEETSQLRRGIRTDLLIAVCALLISGLATGASWWQSRVVAQQLSAQVWPYLSLATTYDPSYVAVDVINNGLGPAIVRSLVIMVDGKPQPTPARAFRALIGQRNRHVRSQISELTAGSVIRAGADVQLFRLNEAWIVPLFAKNSQRVDVRICYCSLLGNCWQTSAQGSDPTPVSRCPDVGADQFRVPPVV